jgi:alpha-galactosidase
MAHEGEPAVIVFGDDSVRLELRVDESGVVRIHDLAPSGFASTSADDPRPLVEVVTTGTGTGSPGRYDGTPLGTRLAYVRHEQSSDRLEVELRDPESGLSAVVGFQLFAAAGALRVTLSLGNDGAAPIDVLAVPTLCIASDRWGSETTRVHYADNDWLAEHRWHAGTLAELGQAAKTAAPGRTSVSHGRLRLTGYATWPTGEHLPMGVLENPEGGALLWQVESHGAWHWQIGETGSGLVLIAGGPTDRESSWSVRLSPGDEFDAVPVTLVVGDDLESVFGGLTDYRRRSRRVTGTDAGLPVIFNDYMNTIEADPTTEKLLPLIAAVSKVGADVFCVDAGWYADESGWWDTVGAWIPSETRFPNGFSEVIGAIQDAGMVPGIWFEPEVVGIRSPVADELPAEAFFQRRGQRVVMDGRYHLDLRHPAAIAHLDGALDRAIAELGIGYVKFDYNISPWAGTDLDAWSPGDGALRASRAHLAWIDALQARHPDLIIENCSSGGMRNDAATMSRFSLASTSDQQGVYGSIPIAAAAPTAMLPEQAGIWCYPQPGMSALEAGTALANGMLARPYLSGHYDGMTAAELARVADFVEAYRGIRAEIPLAHPFWPLGLPEWDDEWIATGLRGRQSSFVTVWRRGGPDESVLPIAGVRPESVPTVLHDGADGGVHLEPGDGSITVRLPAGAAVTFRVD